MAATQRISPLDFDVAPDEELPGYEASTAPAYDSGTYDLPLFIYHLRQYDRRIQILTSYGPCPTSSYRITTNGFRLFSKKPEMEVLYTSPERRQRNIATISFDSDGPLPWRPRAHFDYTDAEGSLQRHDMESVNFADWTLTMEGRIYAWTVDMRPVSLVLCEKNSSIVIARFTYSASGTSAARGAEVGELTIYRDMLTMERPGIDKLVCGLMVTVTHLKKMGRQYTNGLNELEITRAGSISREYSSPHRASSAGFSVT
ncbi:hypothetical protein BKA66DRAFT_456593 [Pyrenochaeta sp. MPI-SDFR-AT-0127]|nr:hypothetical protein BKA66DRAFT_456593 [Pyrenochaeta sp. MPI-SDFR-AT-0127]